MVVQVLGGNGRFQFVVDVPVGFSLLILFDVVHGHLRGCARQLGGIEFGLIEL